MEMEFVIARNDLVRELQTVTGVVEKRSTVPILANLLLESRKGALEIGASDLEVTIRGSVKATVVREGAITLPAAKLHDIARSLPESEIRFKLEDRNQMKITCERSRFRIPGQPREDFPEFPKADLGRAMKIPVGILRPMIERVMFAITSEDPRYSLNGALFLLQKDGITLVATDGHRLAYAFHGLDFKVGEELRVIVGRKALGRLVHLANEVPSDEPVLLGRKDNHVFFEVGQHVLTATVLEGNFPRYENVMPKACDTEVILPTTDFSDAIKRVALLAGDRNTRGIQFAFSQGKLALSTETEMGSAEETLAVDYRGEDMAIGFNARYLLDFLGVVGTGTVKLELNPKRAGEREDDSRTRPGDKPGQLRPEPPGEMDYRYVVMPMQI